MSSEEKKIPVLVISMNDKRKVKVLLKNRNILMQALWIASPFNSLESYYSTCYRYYTQMAQSKGNHNLETSGSISIDSWDNQLQQQYNLFANTCCILLACLVAFHVAHAIPQRQ